MGGDLWAWGWAGCTRLGSRPVLLPAVPGHRETKLGARHPAPLPAPLTCRQVEMSVLQTLHFPGIYGGFYLPSLITSEGKERAHLVLPTRGPRNSSLATPELGKYYLGPTETPPPTPHGASSGPGGAGRGWQPFKLSPAPSGGFKSLTQSNSARLLCGSHAGTAQRRRGGRG